MEKNMLFDELDEKFEAVVRSHQTSMRSFKVGEGEITLTSTTAVIEARFDFDVLQVSKQAYE
jgi:hypothetical protein